MEGELDVLLMALPWQMQGVEELPLFQDAFCLAYHENTRESALDGRTQFSHDRPRLA
jgi:hypothetical protein